MTDFVETPEGRDERVEIMARARYTRISITPWESCNEEVRKMLLDDAATELASLDSAGYEVVKLEQVEAYEMGYINGREQAFALYEEPVYRKVTTP